MPAQVEVAEARSRLDELLNRVKAGEQIVLSEQGRPVATLAPATDAAGENSRERVFGMFKGQVWMSDDFAAPLTDEELNDWGL